MFLYFWCQTSLVSPRAPDPVRILTDPDRGWFSDSSTSMVGLTPKVWEQKRRPFKLSKIFDLKTFRNLPPFEVQSPGSFFSGSSSLLYNYFYQLVWCKILFKHSLFPKDVSMKIKISNMNSVQNSYRVQKLGHNISKIDVDYQLTFHRT